MNCKPALLLLLTLTLAGCGVNLPGQPGPKARPVPADKQEDFDVLFQTNCAACHGKDGKRGPGPPLNDPLFLAIVSEKEIRETLIHGRHNTAMTSFAANPDNPQANPDKVPTIARSPTALTPRQIGILAAGIKQKWPAEKETKGLPPYSAKGRKGSLATGEQAFARACAVCHGKDGKQEGMVIHDPAFLGLISEQALRRIVITGRPDLHMPSYRDKTERGEKFKPLTDEEIDGLQALLVSWKEGSSEGK